MQQSRWLDLVIAEARGFDMPDDLEEVAGFARLFDVDLVLLDSFRSLWLGDERDEAEVAEALDPLRDLAHDNDIAVALTHHLPKHGASEYRGSTAIGACVEWVVVLERFDDDPDKATRRRLANPLARFAPERPDRWLQIRSAGDDGPVSLEAAEPYTPERDTPVRDEIETAILLHIEGCGGEVWLKGDHTTTPPSWSTAELARAAGRDARDWTARQAIQRLADTGVIYRNGGKRWQRAETLFDDDEGEET